MTDVSEPSTKLPPPADITVEARVLGAILYDHRHVGLLPAGVRPETFYSGAHTRIFEAVDELRANGTDVAVATVESTLRARQRLQSIPDGAAYLQKLVDDTPVLTPSAFAGLVRILLDKAAARAAILVCHRAIAQLHGTADPRETIAGVEREMQKLTLTAQTGGLRPMASGFKRVREEWQARRGGQGTFGLSTGFKTLDKVLRFKLGALYVVAARPGMGKTSFLTACAESAATRGEPVGIFSLEMPEVDIAARMICTEAGLSVIATDTRALTTDEIGRADAACDRLSALPLYIDDADKGRPYITDIVTRVRRLAAELSRKGKKLRLVFVDYIQIVKLRAELAKQRHDIALGEVSTELKALAKELDLSVIALAQLNRGVESRNDKRPIISDLKDSGKLEEDADAVAFIYRDEYYTKDASKDPGVAEILVEKHRNGPTGVVRLAFDGPSTRFSDLSLDLGRPTDDGVPYQPPRTRRGPLPVAAPTEVEPPPGLFDDEDDQ